MSIHEIVWDWLLSCPNVQNLNFNFSDGDIGTTTIIPTDLLVNEFVDKSQERRYAVELTIFMPVTFDPNDKGNVQMQEDVEAVAAWLRQQDEERNYPAFPEGLYVTEIQVNDAAAGYAVAQDGSSAKYMLPFEIDYYKEAK